MNGHSSLSVTVLESEWLLEIRIYRLNELHSGAFLVKALPSVMGISENGLFRPF